MDFHELPKDCGGYDTVMILVDCFGKRPISIPCYKTITAKEAACLYIQYPYQIYGPPDTIISDHGPQFISAFWDEFTCILGIKLKLSSIPVVYQKIISSLCFSSHWWLHIFPGSFPQIS